MDPDDRTVSQAMGDRYSDGPHGTTCSGCGQCCVVLQLPLAREDVRRQPADAMPERVRRWYLEDLQPIGWRRAAELAPWLPKPSTVMPVHNGQSLARYPTYYTCRLYDPNTRRCTDWENRPDPCRGYPYYGRDDLEAMTLPPACSFRADRGETPVALTRKEDRDGTARA